MARRVEFGVTVDRWVRLRQGDEAADPPFVLDERGFLASRADQPDRARRCLSCGLVSTSLKARVLTGRGDPPFGGDGIRLVWHKSRWRCRTLDCPQQTFTETAPPVRLGPG